MMKELAESVSEILVMRNLINHYCTSSLQYFIEVELRESPRPKFVSSANLSILEMAFQVSPLLYNMLSTEVCQDVFSWLCVGEDSRTQISTCTLLVRLYGAQPGWGEFLVNTFTQLYSSNYQAIFPQDRYELVMLWFTNEIVRSLAH